MPALNSEGIFLALDSSRQGMSRPASERMACYQILAQENAFGDVHAHGLKFVYVCVCVRAFTSLLIFIIYVCSFIYVSIFADHLQTGVCTYT